MLLKCPDHTHCLRSNLTFQPGGGLLSNSMVVTHRSTTSLNRIENPVLEIKIFIYFIDFGNKDKVKIGTLWIGM